MIELDVTLPLASFTLVVRAKIDGVAIAVLGPSGSGKSSLVEAIAGVRRGVQGRIVVDGEVLHDGARGIAPEKRRIGWVPQQVALFPHLDVARNIAFGARDPVRIREAIEVLELGPLLARAPATLSGGERQRVALARALATDPRLVLLDEPLAAVDVEHRARILPWLSKLRASSRVPIVYVTHHLGEAAALSTHALVLRRGEVIACGPTSEVLDRAAGLDVDVANVIQGETSIDDEAKLLLPGGTLVVPRGDAASGPSSYSLAAEEIVLCTSRPAGVSARNVVDATVARITESGSDALVHLDALGVRLRAKITRAAVKELSLREGSALVLLIKTHALRRLV